MLTFEKAKEIGIDACVEKLGRGFVTRYADTSTSAYGKDGKGNAFCFVGVDNRPQKKREGELILSSRSKFPYSASCLVNMITGDASFLKCVLPKRNL